MGVINAAANGKPVHLTLAKDRVRSVKRGRPWVFADVLADLPSAPPGKHVRTDALHAFGGAARFTCSLSSMQQRMHTPVACHLLHGYRWMACVPP